MRVIMGRRWRWDRCKPLQALVVLAGVLGAAIPFLYMAKGVIR